MSVITVDNPLFFVTKYTYYSILTVSCNTVARI